MQDNDDMTALIEASSFGTPEARRWRAQCPPRAEREILVGIAPDGIIPRHLLINGDPDAIAAWLRNITADP